MEVKTEERIIKPAVAAVTERRVLLDLSEEEARVLRALWGGSGGEDALNLGFLSRLNRLFPKDCTLSPETTVRGIKRVSIEYH